MRPCSPRTICSAMNRCSPARRCRCARLPLRELRRRGPAAMICHTSIPAAWSFVGHGRAEVTATGARSEIGKIGLAITRIDTEPPRLRVQTRRLVRNFAAVSLSLSALAVVLYGLWRGGWLDALLSGIALGMSMLPEEFPLVLTVFMVMGAWRISRARVLTRRVGGNRDARRGDGALHRQDRHADAEPDDDRRAARRRTIWREATKVRSTAVCGASRVRHSRQRARAVRSDGEGVPCPRRRTPAAIVAAQRPHTEMGIRAAAGSSRRHPCL